MDLQLEELQFLTAADVVVAAAAVPRAAPRPFALITLTLVFPLSFAILAHSLFTHPILRRLRSPHLPSASEEASEWSLLLLYQLAYLLFLFTFSLLSTAAVVFTVASLYAARPISFSSALSAIPPIFPRLFRTFLWFSLIFTLYNLAFALAVLAIVAAAPSLDSTAFVLPVSLLALVFFVAHVGISALWHISSVVSVLEPVCGLAAMFKSWDLLRGRTRMAALLVAVYLVSCVIIGGFFRGIVVDAPDEDGSLGVRSTTTKVLVGGALVAVLVVVNLVGLLVQSVFYYVCKSYHHQNIDKIALSDHLSEYLGEYVPLQSSIQMENL